MTDQAKQEKKRPRGLGRVFPRAHTAGRDPVFWIEFWHRGRRYRESSHSAREADAVKLLKRRLGQVGTNTFAGLAPERVEFEDLAALLENDYTVHGRVSLDTAKRSLKHLRRAFGKCRAVDITRAKVDAYIAARLTAKPDAAKPATVRKEIAALSRAFALAVEKDVLPSAPRFTKPKVENTRTVAFTDAELDDVLDVLMNGAPATAKDPEVRAQPDVVAPILFAAITGWRLHSDVLPLRWAQVDLAAGTVTRWGRGTTKAHEHVVFPVDAVPDLKAMLERQRDATKVLERESGSIVPLVFHRAGRPIKSLRGAWAAACARAGVPGRWPHDLRRTGARALRALGMSDRDIAELCGWKTVQMVSRYLGRDPAGVAERLRARVATSETATKPARFANAHSAGTK